ncbi:MAG: DUF2231 domain-containing protein [Solirubrobacteraceae bacterium]
MLTLIKGFAGKPSHAPLTDVSIGAYTVGVLMLIVGYFGFEEAAMSKGALLAIAGGLIVAIPTSLTGLLDWADISKGSNARKLANYHLSVMLLATACFAATFVLHRPGYLDSEITLEALIAGGAALGLLTLGGTLGGALAYVYGVRVVKRDVSLADALIPGKLSEPTGVSRPQGQPAVAAAGGRGGGGYGADAQAGSGSSTSGSSPSSSSGGNYGGDAQAGSSSAPAPAQQSAPPASTGASALSDYEAYITSGKGRN